MTATTTEATAVQQLAELERRISALRGTLDELASRRAEAERTLARALADGVPEKEKRELSAVVEQINREAAGLPGAIELLKADLAPLREAAQAERLAAAEAKADQFQRDFTDAVHVTVEALQTAAKDYLEQHRRMRAAHEQALAARRAALRLAGADQQDVFHADVREPRLGDDGDFAALGRLLARYAAGLE
jgi:seryl-tRNA synthetase